MPGLHSKTNHNEVEEQQDVQPEEKIFNKDDVIYFPPARHVWRQQGPYVVCKECPLSHGVYIGMNKVMVGEDDEGKPILRDKVRL